MFREYLPLVKDKGPQMEPPTINPGKWLREKNNSKKMVFLSLQTQENKPTSKTVA